MDTFFEDSDLAINYRNLKLIDQRKSRYQKASLYKHPMLGKILILNKEVQHVEKWAPFYHEMLIHLPIAFIPTLRNVLILGGGSLFAAHEILKYNSVKNVLLIDHDYNVIDIVEKNYKHAKDVLKDQRFKLLIDDAFNYLKGNNKHYDLIINDSVDLMRYGRKQKSNNLTLLNSSLNKDGICSDVVYRHIFERKTTLKTLRILKSEYYSSFSLITVPEYPGIFHILCLWSKSNNYFNNKKVVNKIQKAWLKNPENYSLHCQFYNPKFINFYLYLPNYLKSILGNEYIS